MKCYIKNKFISLYSGDLSVCAQTDCLRVKGEAVPPTIMGPLARGIMVKKNKFKLSNSSGKKSIMRNSNKVPNEKNVRSSNDSIFMANAEKNMDNQNHQNNSSGKNWNNLTKNQNKEVPSLSQDSGGLQILFLIKTPMTILIFSFFSKNDIFSNKPTYKERQKARSMAIINKKFRGNDQQRPKHLTQVTETQWEVKKIH